MNHPRLPFACRALLGTSLLFPAVAGATPVPDAAAAAARTVLFVGNSFTFGAHSPAWRYRADTVHDLNGDGVGGVPALFKLFTEEAGLHYDVSLETSPGQTLKFHYTQKRAELDRAWDCVVMQEYSTLSPDRPGDPATFRTYADKLARLFKAGNPRVNIRLLATWSRPDQTYKAGGHWYGKPIQRMGDDLHQAYVQVARSNTDIDGVIAVGSAFNRAIAEHVADGNPYDGIAFNQVDLWAWDHYHASVHGYYLEALMDFGSITGKDPRSLGRREQAADELGLSPDQAEALQRIAHEQLEADR